MTKEDQKIQNLLKLKLDEFGLEFIDDLRYLLEYLGRQYYIHDDPQVSDEFYDSLMARLIDLEKKHPELVTENSPSRRVGGTPLKQFKQVSHEFPMLSLQNASSYDELREFDTRLRRLIDAGHTPKYVVEPKVDGLAVSLTYDDGHLTLAATRGDGQVGEDITANARTIGAIPLEISYTGHLVAQGEAYLPIKAFEKLNETRAKDGEKLFANPRNAAAGSIRQLDPQVAASRPLSIFMHSLRNFADKGIATQTDALAWLRKMEFKVNPEIKVASNIEEVISFAESWREKRDKIDYAVDGLVIKFDNLDISAEIGATARAPRWAIAFKFPPREAQTVVLDIRPSVGRTGVITPVATFKPIFLDGSTVTHASLYNMDEIERKDIRINDQVLIAKGGDVIPKVVKVLTEFRDGTQRKFEMPEICPVCGGPVVRKEGEVDYRCTAKNCRAIVQRQLEHFVGRDAMDIEGLGTKIIERFLDEGLIYDAGDIYSLDYDNIMELEGFGEKSASNLKTEVEASKEKPLHRLLNAISIPGVGSEAAKLLEEHFQSFDAIASATTDELTSVKGIGPKLAENIVSFFDDERALKMIDKLKNAGLKGFEKVERVIKSGKLEGKTFVITGTIDGYSRDELKERIEQLGGKVAGSISSKTSYLILGADPGSKAAKARELGTTILEQAEVYKLLEIPAP